MSTITSSFPMPWSAQPNDFRWNQRVCNPHVNRWHRSSNIPAASSGHQGHVHWKPFNHLLHGALKSSLLAHTFIHLTQSGICYFRFYLTILTFLASLFFMLAFILPILPTFFTLHPLWHALVIPRQQPVSH